MMGFLKLLLIEYSFLIEQRQTVSLCSCYRLSRILYLFMALPWEMEHLLGFFPLAYSR